MDDDETEISGPSGAAWFALGRMSAENARSRSAALASLFGRGPVDVDTYNEAVAIAEDWRAECLRLQQANTKLVAELNASRKHAAELKAWGEHAQAGKAYWVQRAGEHKDQVRMMSDRANRFEEEAQRLKGIA